VAEHFELEPEVDLLTGTFSKCFGSLGGMLAGSFEVINYLRHCARSIMFAAAMPPTAVAAALAAIDIIEAEPWRRRRVLDLGEKLHHELRALGFDTGHSETPVVPVYLGESTTCLQFWRELFDVGVFANAVLAPAVPQGRALIRVTLQAVHSDEQLARVVDAFALVGRRLKLIPPRISDIRQSVDIARPVGA
jgi:7-keto-8-aminopelargonate synthetase-like enzyme